MGVPKFYKWISERYPCLSEVVKEYQIPDFDNLYLDMNGIIHICSHPNDNDPHFRMTEEKMFKDIFHYIEVLFRLVQPKQVFFMAVDGVAPRAKMNQQRGRRFRSAREAIENEKKARDRGEVLPSEERFDSNCITPGTEFMVRLDAQLQYFVTSKISQDKMWQNCKVIYSGHETPGEGEHKIMEYIRYTKSQPGYNPNTRHCLYGLDADLMMLGLTSHEPHFSLLREEVRFGGKKDNSRTPLPEETTFHLLHLSLMREYINYEFASLQTALPFKYNLENIIDDWVLMGFLVGNDFIPHLPNLHINKGALPLLYSTYKEVLPTMDGYLNIGGKLHLGRFEKFMKKLAEFDVDYFSDTNADLKYFNSKRDGNGFIGKRMKENLEPFFGEGEGEDDALGVLEGDDLTNDDIRKKFEKLGLQHDQMFDDDDDSDSEESTLDMEFRQHKTMYYYEKMNVENTAEALREQAEGYVTGIQWILNYYYNGISSWSWYYPHHYSPYISDIKGFADMELKFELGKPFKPFEQLLAVLPPLSVKLLPKAYHGLMLNENSPLKKFYPETFQTDLNGKVQDWEAVVLIPFIDEELLLEGMAPCNERLTPRESARNSHGPMYICTYTSDNLGEHKAPDYFPPVGVNHNRIQLVFREEWMLPPEKIYKGLCKNFKLDIYFMGFPSLKHISHTFHVEKAGVRVFNQASREDSYILDITNPPEIPSIKDVADQLLGEVVFVSWPHLVEAMVEAVSDGENRHSLTKSGERIVTEDVQNQFTLSRNTIAATYKERWGIKLGATHILVYAKPMTGRKYIQSSSGQMTLEKEWSEILQPYAYQTIVKDLKVHDQGYEKYLTPQEYFPPRSKVFMLGQPHYGCIGEVIEIDPAHKGRIRVAMTVATEPNLEVVKQKEHQHVDKYMSGSQAAQRTGVNPQLLARITGTVFLAPPAGDNPMAEMETKNKLNIGLNLKNNRRNEEVIGYTRKIQEPDERPIWLYSMKVVEVIKEYQEKFPEIFFYMSTNAVQRDIFYQNEVFPNNYKERVTELTTWLKSADFAKAERQPCGTQSLGEALTGLIIEEVDKVAAIRAKAVKMQVRPHLLFKPNPHQGSMPPDKSVKYMMYDRVVNVREGYSVPLGARGTIVGIQPAQKDEDVMYDILFDEAFNGGLTLRGPASAQRCYRLHWAAMINITHGTRLTNPQLPTENKWNQSPQSVWNQVGRPSGQFYQNSRQMNQNNHFYKEKRYQDREGNVQYNFQHPDRMGNGQQIFQHQDRMRNGQQYFQHQDRMGNGQQIHQHQDRMGNGHQNYQHQDRMGNGQQRPQPLLNQPQGAMGRVHSSKGYDMPKPPHLKNYQPGEVESPQPPDPNQLPSPSGLCMNQFTSSSGRGASWHRNQQDNVVEVYSADEIPCAVHGSFYSHWNDILKNGINRVQGRKGIPCYPFVPQGMTGSKAYQLFIFLDVKSALDDGMRFYKLGEKQLFCSGDRQGCIYSKYFKKVVDKETNRIIYPSRPAVGIEAIPGKQHGNFSNNDQRQVSYGRGKAMASQQPKGMQLYQNIWSQVQGVDQDQVDLRPAQSQMLSKMLNIPNSPHGFGVNQQSSIMQPTTVCNAGTGRKEVSVEDIFRGATNTNHMQRGQQNPNIISMLNAAHNLTNQETQSRRGESPVKSAFVPTQVIRNQTPRKPRQEPPKQPMNTEGAVSVEPSNDQKSEKSPAVSLPPTAVPQNENLQQHRVPASRPRRNRLAPKFSHVPSEDPMSQRDNQ